MLDPLELNYGRFSAIEAVEERRGGTIGVTPLIILEANEPLGNASKLD